LELLAVGRREANLWTHGTVQHFAILYPDRRELARAVERLLEHGYPIRAGEDHGVSISVYLSDPDGNGIELL
jgi:catechol 2,3-dioxygenase